MLSEKLRQEVDLLWDRLWAGGLTNPVTVIDQMSCLMFLRNLDDQDVRNVRAGRSPSVLADTPELAWSAWRHMRGDDLYELVRDQVFPWLRSFAAEREDLTATFGDAALAIPTASLLEQTVAVVDSVTGDGTALDAAGDLFEHVLAKLSVAGHLGQFRTPAHLVNLAVSLVQPTAEDIVCDPACGTASFLVAAGRRAPAATLLGWDIDPHMLRIASMNLAAAGAAKAAITYNNTLAGLPDGPAPTVILANPPFAGTVDRDNLGGGFRVTASKSELLFLDRIEALLAEDGRAAVIVPDGVCSGQGRAQIELRKLLVKKNRLETVVALPAGAFRPYTGVACSLLVWSKRPPQDSVWMYKIENDGFSLDDRRSPLGTSDIPHLLEQWRAQAASERSAIVPVADIEAAGWRLTPGWYLGGSASRVRPTDFTGAARRAAASISDLADSVRLLTALTGDLR